MPIEYQIDHVRRLVSTSAKGILTAEDIFNYQSEVWSRPDVRGYDELVDMSEVESIVSPTSRKMRQLADIAASMDEATVAAKFAIVAPKDLEYGLGRMYGALRDSDPRSTKKVCVFRTAEDALAWIEKN